MDRIKKTIEALDDIREILVEANIDSSPDPQALLETTKILEFFDTAFHEILRVDRGLLEAGLLGNRELRGRVLKNIKDAILGWEKGSISDSYQKSERTLGSFREYFESTPDPEPDECPDEFDK